MPDKVLRYSRSFCSTVSFAILHLGLFFTGLSREVGWIQLCDVIVFEKFRFHCPHANTKIEFHSGELFRRKVVFFGQRFHRIRMDGRPIRKEKVAFSNENRYVWTGPECFCALLPTSHIPCCMKISWWFNFADCRFFVFHGNKFLLWGFQTFPLGACKFSRFSGNFLIGICHKKLVCSTNECNVNFFNLLIKFTVLMS